MRNKHGQRRRTVHAPYTLAPHPFVVWDLLACLLCLTSVYECPGQLAWCPREPNKSEGRTGG